MGQFPLAIWDSNDQQELLMVYLQTAYPVLEDPFAWWTVMKLHKTEASLL
jgi:hypothetical protein